MMERLANMVVSGAPLVPLDVSRYFCIDFAATSAYIEATQPEPAKVERPASIPAKRRLCPAIAIVVAELRAGSLPYGANESHLGPNLPMTR